MALVWRGTLGSPPADVSYSEAAIYWLAAATSYLIHHRFMQRAAGWARDCPCDPDWYRSCTCDAGTHEHDRETLLLVSLEDVRHGQCSAVEWCQADGHYITCRDPLEDRWRHLAPWQSGVDALQDTILPLLAKDSYQRLSEALMSALAAILPRPLAELCAAY